VSWELRSRDPWYVQTGTMFDNPHGVPHEDIIRYILENPPEVIAQVVFGRYVESSGLVFTAELIQQMIDRTLPVVRSQTYLDPAAADGAEEWLTRFKYWGQRYHTGVDFARQTDYTVVTTIDTLHKPARVVYWKRLNRVPWETIYAEVGRARMLFGPNILCDGTGPGGDVAMDALESRLYCPVHHRCVLLDQPQCLDPRGEPLECNRDVYLGLSCAEAFHFTGTTKKQLVDHLRICLSVGYNPVGESNDFGWIRTPPIPQLEEEMTFYTWDDKGLETDCLFSLALAAWSGLEDPVSAPALGSVYGEPR
jgi:hypothetical protein